MKWGIWDTSAKGDAAKREKDRTKEKWKKDESGEKKCGKRNSCNTNNNNNDDDDDADSNSNMKCWTVSSRSPSTRKFHRIENKWVQTDSNLMLSNRNLRFLSTIYGQSIFFPFVDHLEIVWRCDARREVRHCDGASAKWNWNSGNAENGNEKEEPNKQFYTNIENVLRLGWDV